MSAKQNNIPSNQRSIPWKDIFVPEDFNLRLELPKCEEIAADMKSATEEKGQAKGQLVPIIVRNGGTNGKSYTLVSGSRRHKAFEINGWTGREMLAVVREYSKGDVLGRFVDNWTENMERETVSPFDQARRIKQLLDGTYAVDEGEEAVPYDRDTIAARLNISKEKIGKLLRLEDNFDEDLKKLAARAEVPVRILWTVAAMKGEGETEEEQTLDRNKKQAEKIHAYVETKKSLLEQNRTRSVRNDKGKKKKKGNEEPQGLVKESRRVEHAVYRDEEDRGFKLENYIRVIERKQSDLSKERAADARLEAARFEGVLQGIELGTAKIDKIPGLNIPEFRKILRELREEEEAAAAEEE